MKLNFKILFPPDNTNHKTYQETILLTLHFATELEIKFFPKVTIQKEKNNNRNKKNSIKSCLKKKNCPSCSRQQQIVSFYKNPREFFFLLKKKKKILFMRKIFKRSKKRADNS